MLQAALEAGLSAYVAAHQDEREEQGRAMVVRNGRARGRKVTSGAGTLTVQAPRQEYIPPLLLLVYGSDSSPWYWL